MDGLVRNGYFVMEVFTHLQIFLDIKLRIGIGATFLLFSSFEG
jgi:hypothetical protein